MKDDHQPRSSGKPVVFGAKTCTAHKPQNGEMKLMFRCHAGTPIAVTVPISEASVLADDIKSLLASD
jgi:hypothetical protein